MSKIIDAVAIILTFKDEIFLIERQHYLKNFPGYTSFPGGKVDAGDENHHVGDAFGLEARFIGAAIREGKEELGIDLGEMILNNKVTQVDHLGIALTPDFNPYRFATHFLRFRLTEKPVMVVDENEAKTSSWLAVTKIKEKFEKGELLAVPPIRKTCVDLGLDNELTSIQDLNVTYDPLHEVPYIEPLKGIMQIMPLSHTLPPANRTNAFLIGDKHRLLVDPSPKDEDEYQLFKNTVLKFGVDEIFITHHHPDHFEFSNRLARELKLPLSLSQDTHGRIEKKHPNYFSGIEIHFRKEGDVVTSWLGQKVMVYEVPGHDEGQLALASEEMNWFIASDLFQGIGTVVIGDEEGDMKKYMETLKRVIHLSPKVIFPSHGIGLGGVYYLEKILEHRLMREEEILKLHQRNLSQEEMLHELYKEVNPALYPYARKNIQKHLDKLKTEGKI